jgi:hypothetical protein
MSHIKPASPQPNHHADAPLPTLPLSQPTVRRRPSPQLSALLPLPRLSLLGVVCVAPSPASPLAVSLLLSLSGNRVAATVEETAVRRACDSSPSPRWGPTSPVRWISGSWQQTDLLLLPLLPLYLSHSLLSLSSPSVSLFSTGGGDKRGCATATWVWRSSCGGGGSLLFKWGHDMVVPGGFTAVARSTASGGSTTAGATSPYLNAEVAS